MALAYSFKHISNGIRWKDNERLEVESINFQFQVAGREVTQENIRSLYLELLEQLKAKKAFRGLNTSDNMEIRVGEKDNFGKYAVTIEVKNASFSYNHVANPKQAALDTIKTVFGRRFNPAHTP